MAKFNQTNKNSMKTVNKSGHVAYRMKGKEKLVTMVLTTMFGENKFYGDNSNELVELAEDMDAEFLAKLAIYARKEFNMRSVSHVLVSILAKMPEGKQYVEEVCNQCVLRPDDMTEILSCYISMYGKPIPNCLKKGLALSFGKFNEYSLAKYNGGSKSMKLRDILRITHAKPKTKEQSELYGKVINDTLETPYTWEVELSTKGNTKEVWEELIDSEKVGYMALLRNLRNIINSDARNIQKVYDILSDKEKVLKSKQLPFRYFSAYKTLSINGVGSSKTFDTIEIALRHSLENIEIIKGKTLIAIDVSGSMGSRISLKSDISCADIARLLATIGNYICEDCEIVSFDTSLRKVTASKIGGIISSAMNIPFNGGGTDITLPLRHILDKNKTFDRMIMLSDDEINGYRSHDRTCQSLADKYRKDINPNFWVHAIDLQGYGTQQFIGSKTNIVAGWSEKVFEFISLAESGTGNLVSCIEQIEL